MASELNKQRVERLVWILVYGGLLSLVLGMFVQRYDRLLADILQAGGALVACTGALLIWVRSRMK
ncbi:MAG TPA: hypothetical protein DDX06_15490 [Curvibacter sp.]|nr:hypothetical protein [Curvibacter sp.]